MADPAIDILIQAIARNAAAVLSIPSEQTFRHHKSRLLREEPGSFWIEAVRESSELIDQLLAKQAAVGVSFRAGPQKIAFAAPVLGYSAEFQINPQTTTQAMQLKFPAEIRTIQRRNAFRVHVPATGEISIRLWRIPEYVYLKDRPGAAQELSAQVLDLSTGGLGIALFTRADEAPRIALEQRIRIAMRFRDEEELLLEGRVKYLPPSRGDISKPIRCGIQFKKLEGNIEGRQMLSTLNQIIAELQRDETRRARLGLPAL